MTKYTVIYVDTKKMKKEVKVFTNCEKFASFIHRLTLLEYPYQIKGEVAS